MTDKVQKIREEVEKLHGNPYYMMAVKDALAIIDSMQEKPVSKVWHDSNEEPNNMSHCLVFYGDKSLIGHYLHYEPVLYNKQDKVFVTVAYPHPTGYKVEQKSLDGGCVAEVYKDKRDRISISDITSWCYLNDLHNLTQKEKPVSEEWIKELTTKLDSMSKEDLKKVFDKYAIDFNEDPVSEDLSAENFIKDYTKECSNLIEHNCGEVLYQPWLTPEDAMRAVEIAKEEVIEKALDWAKCRLTDRGFKDFKRYMEE